MSGEEFKSVLDILNQFRAERVYLGEMLMKQFHDAMPWDMEFELPNGMKAKLAKLGEVKRSPIYKDTDTNAVVDGDEIIGYGDWEFGFDFRLENCDQDHIEVQVKITGGGGSC